MSFINYVCVCNKKIDTKNLVMFKPCEHIVHGFCSKLVESNCFVCNKPINSFVSYSYLDTKIKNILEALMPEPFEPYYTKLSTTVYPILIYNLLPMHLLRKYAVEIFLRNMGRTLLVKNSKNLYSGQKIIICNHSTPCDILLFTYVFNGIPVHVNDIKAKLLSPNGICVESGVSTTQLINKKMKQTGKNVLIFPEGTAYKEGYIGLFRTGAFVLNYPIQPTTITYSKKDNKYIYDILPIEYPPFTSAKISKIRDKMIKSGNLIPVDVLYKKFKK